VTLQAGVFIAYFIAVFAIGWLSMLRTRDEADYWIAGGKLGWFTGGSTLAATHVSAGTFVGTVGVIYTAGWSFGWVLLSIPLAYWFVAAVLAPRFTRVRQLTLPAFMEARYYSKGVRALAALIALIATVVYIEAQIVAGGLVANIVFGVPEAWGMVAFTAILLAYTVVGGMVAERMRKIQKLPELMNEARSQADAEPAGRPGAPQKKRGPSLAERIAEGVRRDLEKMEQKRAREEANKGDSERREE